MKGEFYKMEFDAWDEGTVELTLEEEAAYLRLCHQMYRRRGSIPNSEKLLCSLWRCHPNKARPLLQRLIDKGKIALTARGDLVNNRVESELEIRNSLSEKRAEAGHAGGVRSGISRRTQGTRALQTPTRALHTRETLGDAPSKPLENKELGEAKRSRGEERRGEETTTNEEIIDSLEDRSRGIRSFTPRLASGDPFAAYEEAELDALQFDFDRLDIRKLLPELWDWTAARRIVVLSERKSAVYGALRSRQDKAAIMNGKDNSPPVAVSAELANSKLARGAIADRARERQRA